ncbi:hypothetical protein ZIOFF_009993 [Zingiber officinale]|uniref:Uncharacterized protein n=1 Tax=Zingiber officinale TaxID=94328 RepID=A0A8J5HGF0_ZINOF|nr:hypothetical protein ZIOFF_009993 [Zingiber officinale]
MTLVVFRDNRWQGDQAILATMEVDLTQGSQMIYVIPEIMMTIGDFYRNIQISILTRGYEAWQNSEANLLITRGLVGSLSNTPNVGFAYEVQGVVDYLTSHGVKALPGRSFSTHRLQGLNWTINPTQITIPMQPSEVNSQTMLDGRISLSFNNYVAAQEAEPPKYNDRDEEILAVLIKTHPGVFTYFDGIESEYLENYGDSDNIYDNGKQIAEQDYSRDGKGCLSGGECSADKEALILISLCRRHLGMEMKGTSLVGIELLLWRCHREDVIAAHRGPSEIAAVAAGEESRGEGFGGCGRREKKTRIVRKERK